MTRFKTFAQRAQNQKGQALLIATVLTAMISLMVTLSLTHSDSVIENVLGFNGERRAFYMAEGAKNMGITIIQKYLETTATPTTEEMTSQLEAQLPAMVPPEYQVETQEAILVKHDINGVVPSGPFAGTPAPITTVNLKIGVREVATGMYASTDIIVSMGHISPFQFLVFSDLDYADWRQGPPMSFTGRVHANSDLCIGTQTTLDFTKITASGRLMGSMDPRCKYNRPSPGVVSVRKPDSTLVPFRDNADNGCINCDGSGQSWFQFALSKWETQAMDVAHGVQKLRVPGALNVPAQFGVDGDNYDPISNQGRIRYLLDPPQAGDSGTVASQRYANNADIRILDGVWYLKDPSNPNSWPGVPIWSDHPGRVTMMGQPVGQNDIRDRWNGSLNQWPAADTPRLFSYYEYDEANESLQDDTRGVISYGNLGRSGAAEWTPGSWVDTSGTTPLCGGNAVTCGPASGLIDTINSPTTCSGKILTCAGAAGDPGRATLLLNATRGGWRNWHVERMSKPPDQISRAKILSVNFNVDQFQQALLNTSPGELGSYFGVGSFMGRSFNGTIYISSTWPGSLTGFGSAVPTAYPHQGTVDDPNQMATIHPATQRALPFPLCSTSAAGQAFDRVNVGPGITTDRFRVPSCGSYTTGGIEAFPSAVRVFQGQTLNPAILSRGISIISNLSVYIMGSYNTSSDVSSATATPWVSSLIAGDSVDFYSNNWTDANAAWHLPPASQIRIATESTLNTALIAGYARTSTGLELHAVPSFMERWAGVDFWFNGSIVIGFYPVYHQSTSSDSVVYSPPERHFKYDDHFSIVSNQPPSTILLPVTSVSRWLSPF